MARTTEYTREIILQSAIKLVRQEGISTLNARNLAKWAGCSTAPLFRSFNNMEEIYDAVKNEMDSIYNDYINNHVDQQNLLLSQGIAYVEFARKEPNIFIALFMNHMYKGMDTSDVAKAAWNQKAVKNVAEVTGLNYGDAQQVFLKIWLYSHGIATQLIASDIDFPPHIVRSLLEDAFARFIK